MGKKIKLFDDDDMSNIGYNDDEEERTDQELLDEWSTEGPDEDKKPAKKQSDGEEEEVEKVEDKLENLLDDEDGDEVELDLEEEDDDDEDDDE